MKRIPVWLSLLSFVYGLSSFHSSIKINETSSHPIISCDSVPLLNRQIVDFVKTKIKKIVGRGECWDLANDALIYVQASWNGAYEFGKEVNYKKECVFPGDIIQFEGVSATEQVQGVKTIKTMFHHTAIIYNVKGEGNYTLAEQNTAEFGRKVGLSALNLQDITKGKFKIYRPVKK